jgi:hypothetical protein
MQGHVFKIVKTQNLEFFFGQNDYYKKKMILVIDNQKKSYTIKSIAQPIAQSIS